ncbi:MAG TPA: hypothetical protein VJ767_01120 [Nitrososphaeraceae archaeon]|jgi:hypothetical protein|nr:hypothetical protein [Nitrososphaeraceae archaeon]
MDDKNIVKKGQFYAIFKKKDGEILILEDRTKRGLVPKEIKKDEIHSVDVENGLIYDMDGIGHKVPIRWYFPLERFQIDYVVNFAEELEKKYKAIRELTCPDD